MGVIYLQNRAENDENLASSKKTKHPDKGERKVQDGWTQVKAKKRNHQ
jgi:hypothetical protein